MGIALVFLALGACKDKPTDPGTPAGVLRFTYSGVRTGVFQASGGPSKGAPSAAYAYNLQSTDDDLSVVAYRTLADPRYYDDITFTILDPKVGTITCATMSQCPVEMGLILFSMREDGPAEVDVRPTSLRLTISALTASSIEGSFEMEAEGGTSAGARAQLSITKGEFNIPRVQLFP
ncbi:hypothetical protein [Longimicrobium sp.]|uniref:hypothetical protein n=1 Tax=Longimicrobium sp. TaxID=2029185 RepID=UPI002F95AD1B